MPSSAKTIDFVERIAATFVETVLALIIANGTGLTNWSNVKVALIAGGLAAAKIVMYQLTGFLQKPPPATPAKKK